MPPEPSPVPLDPLDLLLAGLADAAVQAFRAELDAGATGVDTTAGFAVALAATGAIELDGAFDAVRAAARDASRVERHRAEVIVLALAGRTDRASGLGRELLLDDPDDRLVRHVLIHWCGDEDDLGG